MKIKFSKYHGAGNDFIIIDGINTELNLNENQIALLCNRRFGIGADGMMIIEKKPGFDFGMRYFNSDGKEASMCGNGGRCISLYAFKNGIAGTKMTFSAVDGVHYSEINGEIISLSMNDVEEIYQFDDGFFLNTGSPHFVKFVQDINNLDINIIGKAIADEQRFSPDRTNVNFVEIDNKNTKIATFERGVECETLACGTGAVASAIVLHKTGKTNYLPVVLNAKGGQLSVNFDYCNGKYCNVVLSGPAVFVYSGEIDA